MALLNKTFFVAGAAALVLYFFSSRVLAWRRLRHIPGPASGGWSKFWMARHQVSGKMCLTLEAVCDKYGPLSRIGPNYVVCSDPAEIRRIWSVHSGYSRSRWYNGYRIDPNSDSVLTANENKEHHRIRSHLLAGYSGRGQGAQEQLIDAQIVNFIGLIESKYLSGRAAGTRPLDMAAGMQYLTQDVTSAVEFGAPFGYVTADADLHGVIAALESMQLPCSLLALLPPLLALIKSPLVAPLLPKRADPSGVGRLLGLVHDRVGERYGDAKRHNPDALQAFVESGLSRAEVEAEALVHLLGGSDTTATALRNAVFYLSTHPRAYRRLQAEIDAAAGIVARPVIADTEAKKLPFLQACIKETLRMWPPISGLMPKVSDRDDVICGVAVPAGTNVAWAVFGVMKNRTVFGEDAGVFEPMRWVEADAARLRDMEATQGLVFAGGTRWDCLGKKLAYAEMGKVIFELFLRFDFSMTDPIKPFNWFNQGFTQHEHMNVTITKRDTITAS
ncbi:cytochrome P450 family protein [Lasiosphaeris hirsuta]|uniref:Cytochrome P450 family protein n=1 Tax=Lasiosphaeris hirsuta TaxID=260670 RepID=A0AA40AZN3_9PEZI|nr:cytochrome P450 family protein [Lasiosphaeris hirsuta]